MNYNDYYRDAYLQRLVLVYDLGGGKKKIENKKMKAIIKKILKISRIISEKFKENFEQKFLAPS